MAVFFAHFDELSLDVLYTNFAVSQVQKLSQGYLNANGVTANGLAKAFFTLSLATAIWRSDRVSGA